MERHVLSVCTSCASAHRMKQAIRRSGGERLLAKLQTLGGGAAGSEHPAPIAGLSIEPNECLGACDRACAIAFMFVYRSKYQSITRSVKSDLLWYLNIQRNPADRV